MNKNSFGISTVTTNFHEISLKSQFIKAKLSTYIVVPFVRDG